MSIVKTESCAQCGSEQQIEVYTDDTQLVDLADWIRAQLAVGKHLQMDSQIAIDVLDASGAVVERRFLHPSKIPVPYVHVITAAAESEGQS